MKAIELKKKYLEFFKSKGHAVIPSAPLIPEHDPTVLFTTAGMHPLVPFIMGEKHPLGKRIVNVQKCLRTGDIDGVGDACHHTFFEMLGNWSFGDYFKKEAIEMSFEFLREGLGLPLEKLGVTCFGGDKRVEQVPKDEEAGRIWHSLGVPKERIAFIEGGALKGEDNWWGPAGESGPCGPSTEMFCWVGEGAAPDKFNPKEKGWVEIWNDVFITYNKTKEGQFFPLKQKTIDTGLGVERVTAVLQGYDDDYRTELFWPIIKKIEELTKKKYEMNEKAMRIIADHLRAAVFILGDERGAVPSNLDQGYVLRRLIRRVIRYFKVLGKKIEEIKMDGLVDKIIEMYKKEYPLLGEKKKFILEELEKEEEKFKKTLEKGLKKFGELAKMGRKIEGNEAFLLFQSYGFPIEMTEELAKEKKMKVDVEGFYGAFTKHQELSRAGAEKKFKGGLADASEETTKLHTATHLLGEALKRRVSSEIRQKGSNITPERLRFDFNFGRKLTDGELKEVEEEVNKKIEEGLEVKKEEMMLSEALKKGAQGEFGAKYPAKVSVYTIGKDYSKEICMGPHAKNTSELGGFKIVKEEAVAAGVRRIKAVVEKRQ